ncbi:type VI secretion system baseplate subunit TssG [Pantoea sp. NPDC088449]|uniref:type VI secretion system baseplate subunit TssG n=1 Tax=Pantoea sp. NPDC088449 TaxID=3364392 RepID=UPI0037FF6ECE
MADLTYLSSMDYFALLREIERRNTAASRLGTLNDNSDRQLRILQKADLAFASREVAHVLPAGERITITLRHFGLLAPYGPMPLSVTEHTRAEKLNHSSNAFGDFLSLLSQRQAIFWYRSWSQLQPMVSHDRPGDDNRFLARLGQIAGIPPVRGYPLLQTQLRQVWPAAWLAGRASLRDLQQMLSHFFSIPCRLDTTKGEWIKPQEKRAQHKMGHLGATRLGSRIFDAQHSLHIEIGPLGFPDYQSWQRGEKKLQLLASVCQTFVRHQMQLTIDLLLLSSPELAQAFPTRLGSNSWLKPRHGVVSQRVWQSPT